MSFILLFLAITYFLANLMLVKTWLGMPVFTSNSEPDVRLTVIIPCRNEAQNLPLLLTDLNAQRYPNFEVIIADDASTDGTAQLADQFPAAFPLTVLRLMDEPTTSPKKRAITQAMHRASGTLIVTTDGDCRVGPDWLLTLAQTYAHSGAKLISAPVTFFDTPQGGLFEKLQIVEFASLIGSGAVTMALGRPSMCNGANLCYEKSAFEQVGGFAGNEQLASGDDEFLMHKIAAHFPGKVHFLKSNKAIVKTAAHQSAGAFYRQRRRWASKWRFYRDWRVTALAVTVFLLNFSLLIGVLSWWMGWISGLVLIIQWVVKFSAEAVFLALILRFLGQKRAIYWIGLTQVIYPVYVSFFGFVAQGRGYRWKGRKLE